MICFTFCFALEQNILYAEYMYIPYLNVLIYSYKCTWLGLKVCTYICQTLWLQGSNNYKDYDLKWVKLVRRMITQNFRIDTYYTTLYMYYSVWYYLDWKGVCSVLDSVINFKCYAVTLRQHFNKSEKKEHMRKTIITCAVLHSHTLYCVVLNYLVSTTEFYHQHVECSF